MAKPTAQQLNGVYLEFQKEQTEDVIENIFAARRLHRRDRADGLVVAGDAIKQGYNELLPHLKNEFQGAQFPQPMKVGHEAKTRRKKRKGSK